MPINGTESIPQWDDSTEITQAFISRLPDSWQGLARQFSRWQGTLILPGQNNQDLITRVRQQGFMAHASAPGWSELTLNPQAHVAPVLAQLIWPQQLELTGRFGAAKLGSGSPPPGEPDISTWPEWETHELACLRGEAVLRPGPGPSAEHQLLGWAAEHSPRPTGLRRLGLHLGRARASARDLRELTGHWTPEGARTIARITDQYTRTTQFSATCSVHNTLRHWNHSGGQFTGAHQRWKTQEHENPRHLWKTIRPYLPPGNPSLLGLLKEHILDRTPLQIRLSSDTQISAVHLQWAGTSMQVCVATSRFNQQGNLTTSLITGEEIFPNHEGMP